MGKENYVVVSDERNTVTTEKMTVEHGGFSGKQQKLDRKTIHTG